MYDLAHLLAPFRGPLGVHAAGVHGRHLYLHMLGWTPYAPALRCRYLVCMIKVLWAAALWCWRQIYNGIGYCGAIWYTLSFDALLLWSLCQNEHDTLMIQESAIIHFRKMWRINEFGGLTKTGLLHGRGVYMVLCLCRLSPHELQSIKLLLQCWTVWSRRIQCLYKTILSLTLTKTACQTAVKSPNDGGFWQKFSRS